MSNDIQKYRYLIENIILDESFKDAERIFTDANGNQKEVSSYIELFRELAKRNKIQGIEKDISRWIKNGWEEFKEFVDSKKEVQSKSEVKSIQKKDSIQVYKDEEKQVVIPLTKEASIHYGKNTSWCTSYAKARNHFVDYFYANKITLFYVLFKDGVKYACALYPDTIKCYDQQDKSITFEQFEEVTGISNKDIQNWHSSNRAKIEYSRDLNKVSEEVQLAVVQEDSYTIKSITNPSEEVQLAAVQDNVNVIDFIKNPSEKAQIAAVSDDGTAIYYIIKKGIEPSEEVQLAAVQQYGKAIQYIANPSEEVQLAAVSNDGSAIIRIIDKGIKPSEEVQLAAVKRDGRVIEYIIDKGIKPSEELQLAAVQQNGTAIRFIDNPSEAVQLAAVQKHGGAIKYLKNPSEKVKALYNKLYK